METEIGVVDRCSVKDRACSWRKPLRIVIADDHAIVREGLRMILEAGNLLSVVGDAADGEQAVRMAQQLQPDVVVMDLSMPVLSGIEATRQICGTCSSTRIVILSMHATSEHVYHALQAGALGYVLKESAGREVLEAVRTVSSGVRYVSQRIADSLINSFVLGPGLGSAKSPLERLSPREREILQQVAESKSSAEIAKALHLSPKTIETYRSRLMQKLAIHDIPGLVKFAVRFGLTTAD